MFNEDLTVFFNSHEFAMEAFIQGQQVSGYLSHSYPTLQDHNTHTGTCRLSLCSKKYWFSFFRRFSVN